MINAEILVSNPIETHPPYPCIRIWKRDIEDGVPTPLVVLFTSEGEGVALNGVSHKRIGMLEEWEKASSEHWSTPEAVTLKNA